MEEKLQPFGSAQDKQGCRTPNKQTISGGSGKKARKEARGRR
jgi:hypothetical protein